MEKNIVKIEDFKEVFILFDKIGFTVKRYDVSDRYNGSMELILQK